MLLQNLTITTQSNENLTASILIENNRIAAVSATPIAAEQDEQILDLRGARLAAGMIDVHNHGGVGVDVNAADANALHSVSKFLATKGVTGWLPTLVPDSLENYQKSIRAIDELMRTQTEREPAAQILGVHYEGPFVSEKQCGALQVRHFKQFSSVEDLRFMPRLQTADAVHFTTLAPEIANGVELIAELVKQNWIVSIGHTRAEAAILERAFAAGARHLTHFFNQMSALHHRNLGVVGWGLTRENVTFDIIADNLHVALPILELAIRHKKPQNVTLISDSIAPTNLGDGEFEVWNEPITVTGNRTENTRGDLAGSVITLLDAARNLKNLDFTNYEIEQMTARNPAKLLKLEKDSGAIEVGRRANLVAFDANDNVILTLIEGRIAFNRLS